MNTNKNIIIPNPEKLKKLQKEFCCDGVDKVHVVSDFDKTLTTAFVNGKKCPSLISILRDDDKYLSSDYAKKAHILFNKYHPIEIDPNINIQKKRNEIHKWWFEHYKLLSESGLKKKHIHEIILSSNIKLRIKTNQFFDFLYKYNIPLIIMSANGLGDESIKTFLQYKKIVYNNIHIISNTLKFDKNGHFIKVIEPIIHSMNKNETVIKNLKVFKKIENRKNIILLGDGLGDINMADGFNYNKIIKIGFLNDNVDKKIGFFKENYDVIILNDSSMEYINILLKKILKT